MKKPAIIGMGNPLMSDEGIGVRVVDCIEQQGLLSDHIDVLDLGTSGMSVLHEIQDRDVVAFVDCAMMGEEPGAMRRFRPDQVRSMKIQTRLSLHEGDLLNMLSLASRLDQCPERILIFGVQPEVIEPGDRLSPVLERSLDLYAKIVASEFTAYVERCAVPA